MCTVEAGSQNVGIAIVGIAETRFGTYVRIVNTYVCWNADVSGSISGVTGWGWSSTGSHRRDRRGHHADHRGL